MWTKERRPTRSSTGSYRSSSSSGKPPPWDTNSSEFQRLKNNEFLEFLGSTCNLKRLASAVQLRPWPPHLKELSGIASCPPSPLSVRYFSARSGSVPGYD